MHFSEHAVHLHTCLYEYTLTDMYFIISVKCNIFCIYSVINTASLYRCNLNNACRFTCRFKLSKLYRTHAAH